MQRKAINILRKLCNTLVLFTILCRDARSTKYKILPLIVGIRGEYSYTLQGKAALSSRIFVPSRRHLHLAPRLIINGILPLIPLYAYVAWTGQLYVLCDPTFGNTRTFQFFQVNFNLQAPCVLYIRTGVSLLSRERFLYI